MFQFRAMTSNVFRVDIVWLTYIYFITLTQILSNKRIQRCDFVILFFPKIVSKSWTNTATCCIFRMEFWQKENWRLKLKHTHRDKKWYGNLTLATDFWNLILQSWKIWPNFVFFWFLRRWKTSITTIYGCRWKTRRKPKDINQTSWTLYQISRICSKSKIFNPLFSLCVWIVFRFSI